MPSARRPRVVVVSPSLPSPVARDAGTHYLQTLREHLEPEADLTWLVPDYPLNRAADPTTSPTRTHLLPGPGERARGERWHQVVARWDLSRAYSPFVRALRDGSARAALAAADVVDLQWPEHIRLVRTVRRLAPRARVLGTCHDVYSQAFARQARAAPTLRARAKWHGAGAAARAHELIDVPWLDHAVCFSDKDLALLPSARHGNRVLRPPLATDALGPHGPLAAADPVVLLVGAWTRVENQDGLRWMLAEVWPTVQRARPRARLRLVGGGLPADLVDRAAAAPGVEVVGFVPDLAAEHHRARLCVAPLRLGAGVKFKVVESMAAGLPVVTTTVGSEGIAGPELFVAVVDEPTAFARAVIEALDHPDDALGRAARAWARTQFGPDQFTRSLDELYLAARP